MKCDLRGTIVPEGVKARKEEQARSVELLWLTEIGPTTEAASIPAALAAREAPIRGRTAKGRG
jgi:hypothetical protein